MFRYQGVRANHRDVAERFAQILSDMGYKTRVRHSVVSSRIFFKKGFFGKERSIVLRSIGEDLTVEGDVIGEIIQALDDAVLSCSANPSAFKPLRETMMEQARKMMTAIPGLGKLFGAPTPPPQQPSPQPQPVRPTPKPAKPKLEACPNCGAPLRYDPEEIIVTCPYCGFTINVTGEPIKRHSMLPLLVSGADALRIAKDYVAKGIFTTRGMAERAEWSEFRLYWVPVWLYTVNVRGYVVGRRALVATKDTKAQILQEVGLSVLSSMIGGMFGRTGRAVERGLERAREERTEISETLDVPVVARKSAMFQLEPGKWKVPIDKKQPYTKAVEGEVLGVEIGEEAAREKARSEALAIIRSRYTTVLQFEVDAQVLGEGELMHVPFWFIKYTMGGKEYAVVVDACSGQVVAGQRPWLPPIRRG